MGIGLPACSVWESWCSIALLAAIGLAPAAPAAEPSQRSLTSAAPVEVALPASGAVEQVVLGFGSAWVLKTRGDGDTVTAVTLVRLDATTRTVQAVIPVPLSGVTLRTFALTAGPDAIWLAVGSPIAVYRIDAVTNSLALRATLGTQQSGLSSRRCPARCGSAPAAS